MFLSAKTAVESGAHNATFSLHRVDWPSDGEPNSVLQFVDVVWIFVSILRLFGAEFLFHLIIYFFTLSLVFLLLLCFLLLYFWYLGLQI